MSALLSRRDERCLSDLTMDRFLLGETADSNEGRALERHLAWCSQCLARMQSLRSLYGHAEMPEVTDEPPLEATTEVTTLASVDACGVLEVVLLRDGLLIGTEVFTSGAWLVGSAPRAQLHLQATGVAAEHARLSFRDGDVSVERLGGPVMVNGYHVQKSALRSVDELIVGPFVVRTRVIRERWAEPAPSPGVIELKTRRIRALPSPAQPTVVSAPLLEERQTAVRVELFWGDTLQAAELLKGDATASYFPPFTPGREPSLRNTPEGMRLSLPGAQLEAQRVGRWQAVGDEVTLTPGLRVRAVEGALRLEVRLDASPDVVPAQKWASRLEGGFVPLASFFLLALVVFGVAASTVEEDDAFAARTTPKLSVHLVPPSPKQVPAPLTRKTEVTSDAPRAEPKPSHPRPSAPPTKAMPPHLKGLAGLDKALELTNRAMKKLEQSTTGVGTKRPGVLGAGLDSLPRGGAPNGGLALGVDGVTGIGVKGLQGRGEMRAGRTGKGKVGGLLAAPIDRTKVSAPVGTIDRDAVAAVINSHLAEVSRCYESALLLHPDLSGKLKFEWVISPSGTVSAVKLKEGSMPGTSVASCVSSSIKQWKFPQPRGGSVPVSYPFLFRASGF